LKRVHVSDVVLIEFVACVTEHLRLRAQTVNPQVQDASFPSKPPGRENLILAISHSVDAVAALREGDWMNIDLAPLGVEQDDVRR